MEWLAAPQGAATTTEVSSKHVQEKRKRKIVEGMETEQSYKFKEDPPV